MIRELLDEIGDMITTAIVVTLVSCFAYWLFMGWALNWFIGPWLIMNDIPYNAMVVHLIGSGAPALFVITSLLWVGFKSHFWFLPFGAAMVFNVALLTVLPYYFKSTQQYYWFGNYNETQVFDPALNYEQREKFLDSMENYYKDTINGKVHMRKINEMKGASLDLRETYGK